MIGIVLLAVAIIGGVLYHGHKEENGYQAGSYQIEFEKLQGSVVTGEGKFPLTLLCFVEGDVSAFEKMCDEKIDKQQMPISIAGFRVEKAQIQRAYRKNGQACFALHLDVSSEHKTDKMNQVRFNQQSYAIGELHIKDLPETSDHLAVKSVAAAEDGLGLKNYCATLKNESAEVLTLTQVKSQGLEDKQKAVTVNHEKMEERKVRPGETIDLVVEYQDGDIHKMYFVSPELIYRDSNGESHTLYTGNAIHGGMLDEKDVKELVRKYCS